MKLPEYKTTDVPHHLEIIKAWLDKEGRGFIALVCDYSRPVDDERRVHRVMLT